jgi:hypothetical protein
MTPFPLLGLIFIAVLAACVSSASNLADQDRIAIAEDKSIFLSGPGERDAWFDSLSQAEKDEHWSFDEDLVFNKKMKKLRNFETTVGLIVEYLWLPDTRLLTSYPHRFLSRFD